MIQQENGQMTVIMFANNKIAEVLEGSPIAAARRKRQSCGSRSRGTTNVSCCIYSAAPAFKVDPSWPLDMPNHWIMGRVTGVFIDTSQHVWVTHLPETLTEEELYEEHKPPMSTCCKAAPPVLEFDAQGQLAQGWGRARWTTSRIGRANRTASSSITSTTCGSAATTVTA
jgi:hypothetical protein